MFEFCVHWFALGFGYFAKGGDHRGCWAVALLRLLRWGDSNIRQPRVDREFLAGMLPALPATSHRMFPPLRLPLVPSPDALLVWTNRLLEQAGRKKNAPPQKPSADEAKSASVAALVDQPRCPALATSDLAVQMDRRDFGDRMPPLPG